MGNPQRTVEVIIVGAGPAGLLLGCELLLSGVDTVILERDPQRPGFCRGFNLNARALDLLARRGLAERFLAEGWRVPVVGFHGLPVTLGLDGAATEHPYSLGIPQTRVEEILEEHVVAAGVDLRRGHELRALHQDSAGVTAEIRAEQGDYQLRAAYLVGCDGGRSTVRKQAGIDFPGSDPTNFALLGDVERADPEQLPLGMNSGPNGGVSVIPRPGYVRVITTDRNPPSNKDTPVTLDILQESVNAALDRHLELRDPRWLTRFGDAARLATDYVRGRVVLAGDAAHIHPPAGAIGVNVALDDAFNLGWKLAATVREAVPAHVLESYHTERHAAGERILANTQAQVLLANAGEDLAPLIDLITRVAGHPAGNRAFAEAITGLDTRYEMHPDGSHAWLGRLVPNLALRCGSTGTDLATLLAPGRSVLLDFSGDGAASASAAGWSDRVDIHAARCPEHPELRAILSRPDGHTAWVDTGEHGGNLAQALTHWHGPPATDSASA